MIFDQTKIHDDVYKEEHRQNMKDRRARIAKFDKTVVTAFHQKDRDILIRILMYYIGHERNRVVGNMKYYLKEIDKELGTYD